MDEFIERRIITGLIVSNDYIIKVRTFWDDGLIESPELRRVARWCLDHYEKYQKAPDKDIELIFLSEMKSGHLGKAEGQFIETLLTRISDDFERGEKFNSAYLYDQTTNYFRRRALQEHAESIQIANERGETDKAEELAQSYHRKSWNQTRGIELNSDLGFERLRQAFERTTRPVVQYPGDFGQMVNRHLIRDGFVAFMGPEKRGKTFMLLDLAFRGLRQKSNVAFFSAGDLTEDQTLRRIGVYLARRSDDPAFCQPYWRAVGDCVWNLFDTCERKDRNCSFGAFNEGALEKEGMAERGFETLETLVEQSKRLPTYQPCDSATCTNRVGTVWLIKEPEKEPLSGGEAVDKAARFFKSYRRRFKLATYASDTLTCAEILDCLTEWERADDFVPDEIIVDYADIMTAPINEFRHRQDAIWKGLRRISQEKHCLVVTATQTNADSYVRTNLSLSNFSEDKRKYAHVTAMWGLNQDPKGREKELGILRINEIVIREGPFKSENSVAILQDLRAGRPFLEGFRHHPRIPPLNRG